MLYVGFTEDHKNSAHMFASMVGAQILARSKSTPDSQAESTEQTSTLILPFIFPPLFFCFLCFQSYTTQLERTPSL